MFSLLEELAAIDRSVAIDGDLVSVTLTRRYTAPTEEVWDALTTPERLSRWFYPISGSLATGGNFQLDGNAGGDILLCDRPARLRVTFGGPESIVEISLTAAGAAGEAESTTLEFAHSVPLAMAGSGAGALFVGPGWDGALLGLGIHLRGESVGDPRTAAKSPDVIEFTAGSIDRWTAAIEASGTADAEQIAGGRAAAIAQFTTMPS